MKLTYASTTTLLAACLVLGINDSAFAQPRPAPMSIAHGSASAQAGPESQSQDESQDDNARSPVLQVTSVEVIRSAHEPTLDIIRVRGLTSTGGWSDGELVPLTTGAPLDDGILELMFVARAPTEAMEATGYGVIEAILPIEPGHPYKGVRVHGASKPVTLKAVPGYAEGGPPGEDCSKCVGKYFVAKGAPLPAGKSEAEIVKEEHLPAALRVIKPSDGIGKLDSDPNRMTLVVGEDGRIVTAVWD
jgi:hypothetical protein